MTEQLEDYKIKLQEYDRMIKQRDVKIKEIEKIGQEQDNEIQFLRAESSPTRRDTESQDDSRVTQGLQTKIT